MSIMGDVQRSLFRVGVVFQFGAYLLIEGIALFTIAMGLYQAGQQVSLDVVIFAKCFENRHAGLLGVIRE
ncbi:hypothetical protein DK37_22305 [Halomonas sp. SUBG004]|nr:hypothetical protein DK37_22305 [Halomonas sp. SUBG004]